MKKKLKKEIKEKKGAKNMNSLIKINSSKKVDSPEQPPNIKKGRNAGIDLARILAMYAIVANHVLGFSAQNKYPHYRNELEYFKVLMYWHVSAFIFISGYVGYKSFKYSNLLYLWLCTLFYTIGINLFFNNFKPNIYKKEITLMSFFIVINNEYWYFTIHFGMCLFLPVINKGIENLSKSQLKVTIITLISILLIAKDYFNPNIEIFRLHGGNSVTWFLIYYITGAYFGKYKKDMHWIKIILYRFLYIFIFYYSSYLCINLPRYPTNNYNPTFKDKFIIFLKSIFTIRINSIGMILQSSSLILFLTTIEYNKYIAKFITFIGPLTYGIYLSHNHNIIKPTIIDKLFDKEPYNLTLNTVKKLILLKALKIFVICAIIDYLRDLLFRLLFIRKICILFEKLLFIFN